MAEFNIGLGWVAFWGFASRLVVAGACVWIAFEAAGVARAIWVQ